MGGSDSRIPLGNRLTIRLTGGVILVLLLVGVPFLFAFHRLLRDQQIEALSQATTRLSQVVVQGLRSSMLAGQPHLLDDAVRRLYDQPEVTRVILLDHSGRVRVTSDPAYEGRVLDRQQDRSCRVCHAVPGGEVPKSRTIVTKEGGRRLFRAMSVIPNDPECHRCHDASVRTNGILLMDLALSEEDRRFFANISGTVALGSVMVILTVGVLIFLLRGMVHAPLGAVVGASRRILEGDLTARVSLPQPGEFGLLATTVNRMTEHLARSLETVETQRKELQEILEAVDDEIVVLDKTQCVVASNRAFRAGCGLPEGDLAGRPCREASGPRWPCVAGEPAGCPVQKVFMTGLLQKGIMSRTRRDGREQVIEIHASPLRGPDGAVEMAVEVRRDISERRQMEASLAHSERLAALGLLATGISHEINNPLGAIATSVEGLRRRLSRDPEELRESPGDIDKALGRIADQVWRGRAITDRLLKVARPPGAARALVEVNAVVQDVVSILSHQMKNAGVASRLELAEGLPPLRGDESGLAQVIMNLTLNAIQAMDGRRGEILIATSRGDGCVQLEVRDTGCGIRPELLARIYEPFFTTKAPGRGTGLGLFITHRLVTDFGGSIEVRSELERGTAVTVHLPWSGPEARS